MVPNDGHDFRADQPGQIEDRARCKITQRADVMHGQQIYAEACVACHGEAGDGGHGGGPTLIAGLPVETIQSVAGAGRNTMPSFGAVYSPSDLRDVATYIVDVLAGKSR